MRATPAERTLRDHDTTAKPVESVDGVKNSRATALCTVLLSLVAAVWPASFAAAQAACTEIEADAERLACYDRALRPARPAQPAAAPAQPAAAPPAAPTAAPTQQAAPQPPAAPAAQQVVPQAPPPAAEPAPPAPVAGQQPPREPRPAAAPTAPAARSATENATYAGPVVIVATREAQGRAIVFTTADGGAWVQTDSQRTYLPDPPFEAEIKEGVAGSYFIVPERGGRAVRVRRAQ
jgi:outer membrane biosynthesis protein TonB